MAESDTDTILPDGGLMRRRGAVGFSSRANSNIPATAAKESWKLIVNNAVGSKAMIAWRPDKGRWPDCGVAEALRPSAAPKPSLSLL